MSHNKTLAAQLYGEFKEFFPHNAVRYFVSYYDYYQPEAYIPQRDIYIEKDASINEEIERLRLAATSALVSRNDVIVVASVSCIYGLGSPDDYRKMMVRLKVGEHRRPRRDAPEVRRHPVRPQRRQLRARASSASAATSSSSGRPTRRSPTGSSCSATRSRRSPIIDPLTGAVLEKKQEMYIYPAKHFVLPEERIKGAVEAIQAGAGGAAQDSSRSRASCSKPSGSRRGRGTTWRCSWRSATARGSRTTAGTSRAASRARRRTRCSTSSRADSLLFIDESHVTVPQIRGMFAGDFSRKSTLVEHGFRLPSALDNRPLRFDEWEKKLGQRVYVSATPGRLRGRDVRRRGRRAGHPADRPDRPGRPRRARARARSPPCSTRPRSGPRRASASWSPR